MTNFNISSFAVQFSHKITKEKDNSFSVFDSGNHGLAVTPQCTTKQQEFAVNLAEAAGSTLYFGQDLTNQDSHIRRMAGRRERGGVIVESSQLGDHVSHSTGKNSGPRGQLKSNLCIKYLRPFIYVHVHVRKYPQSLIDANMF